MQQIANIMNISKVSVSKALRGKEGISEKLRNEVLITAESLGYIQKKHGATVTGARFAYLISKYFFLEKQPFYTIIHYYLNKIVQNEKNELLVFVIDSSDIASQKMPEQLSGIDIKGIFVAGEFPPDYVVELKKYQRPVVLIDFECSESHFPCVISNNYNIGYDATHYLIKQGHREIGFAGSIKETINTIDRFFGYRKALYVSDLPFDEKFNVINMMSEAGLFLLGHDLPNTLPTAFVCHCDMAAYFLIQKLVQIGFRTPDDISVISIDNTELSLATSPQLTTLDIDKETFAYKAYCLMMDILQTKKTVPERTYIQHKLIVRDSVKPYVMQQHV